MLTETQFLSLITERFPNATVSRPTQIGGTWFCVITTGMSPVPKQVAVGIEDSVTCVPFDSLFAFVRQEITADA